MIYIILILIYISTTILLLDITKKEYGVFFNKKNKIILHLPIINYIFAIIIEVINIIKNKVSRYE